jgi:hypothetical protein
MPAGIDYALYAAERSIVTGRYFYNLSCLHITEATRTFIKHRVDGTHPNTPSDSIAAWETLTRLLAALPFVDIPRTFVNSFLSTLFQHGPRLSDASQAAPRPDDHVPETRRLCWPTYRHRYQVLHGECLQGCPQVSTAYRRPRGNKQPVHGRVHSAR